MLELIIEERHRKGNVESLNKDKQKEAAPPEWATESEEVLAPKTDWLNNLKPVMDQHFTQMWIELSAQNFSVPVT